MWLIKWDALECSLPGTFIGPITLVSSFSAGLFIQSYLSPFGISLSRTSGLRIGMRGCRLLRVGFGRHLRVGLRGTCDSWSFLWVQLVVSCDFFLLSRDFFSCLFPRRDTNTLAYLELFRPQAANAVNYSICSLLEASDLAIDVARSSSATHPSQSCSPQQPMETFARDKQGSIYTPFRA